VNVMHQLQNSQICERTTTVGRCQVCPRRLSQPLGELGTRDRLWLPCRPFCGQKVFPFPKEPVNADECQLWFRLAVCHCLCSASKWKHIKFHLSAYSQCTKYSASLGTCLGLCVTLALWTPSASLSTL
jgi:hypothetical protein